MITKESPRTLARYEYDIVRAHSHDKLAEMLNAAAGEGWEPVMVYAWNTGTLTADHACLLRKPITTQT